MLATKCCKWTGDWVQDPAEAAAYHTVGRYLCNQTLASGATNATWRLISASVAAAAEDRYLQLRFTSSGGPGMMFIDGTFVGANVTSTT